MRRSVLLSLVTGCAFNPAGESVGDDDLAPDASSVTTDASGVSVDALPSSIDGPACPDTDGDGLCNAVDPWPCGATAPVVPATVTTGTDVAGSVSLVSIAGGGNTAVVQRGAQLSYSLLWTLLDTDFLCMSCQDQIEVGLVAGGRHGCVYDANPPQNQLQSGTALTNMTAPATPGVYSLRFQVARDFSCNAFGRTGWWIGEPSAEKTFGVICVP